MITTHAEALEGLRNAREQLHDVVLFLKGSDTETEWAAHVALDWTRNAIHYGEEEALSDVLHAMRSGLDTRTQDERDCDAAMYAPAEHIVIQISPAHTANVRTWNHCKLCGSKTMLTGDHCGSCLQELHDAQCGPLCEAHGDPRDNSLRVPFTLQPTQTTDSDTTASESPLSAL